MHVLPNTICPPSKKNRPAESPPNVVFLGSYSYPPNAIAADLLVTKIWPIVHEAFPDARLLIAGANPEFITSFSRSPPGVNFLGFIRDLANFYANARVVCTPIQSGGGTRVKIIEAAMLGLPVVSTSLGAEGLNFQAGSEILIEDNFVQMARLTFSLLEDIHRGQLIGEKARRKALQVYSRSRAIKKSNEIHSPSIINYRPWK